MAAISVQLETEVNLRQWKDARKSTVEPGPEGTPLRQWHRARDAERCQPELARQQSGRGCSSAVFLFRKKTREEGSGTHEARVPGVEGGAPREHADRSSGPCLSSGERSSAPVPLAAALGRQCLRSRKNEWYRTLHENHRVAQKVRPLHKKLVGRRFRQCAIGRVGHGGRWLARHSLPIRYNRIL